LLANFLNSFLHKSGARWSDIVAATLGVSTIEYLPWAILNYAGIVFAVILAITGIGIAKLSAEEKKKYLALENDTDAEESV
jgi:NhaC family Na+:H+ antiporter